MKLSVQTSDDVLLHDDIDDSYDDNNDYITYYRMVITIIEMAMMAVMTYADEDADHDDEAGTQVRFTGAPLEALHRDGSQILVMTCSDLKV